MQFSFGEYQLDTEARSLQRSGQVVHVEPKAFDLLAYLIAHRERVASPDELLETLWPGAHVGPAALSTAVRKAREAVGDDGEQQTVLRTKHGHGFQFVADVRVVDAAATASQKPWGSRIRWAAAAGLVVLLLVAIIFWRQSRPISEPVPSRSVAVLPFSNMSQDAATEPFTIGIHDDILTQISKIRGLKVIARTTMKRLDPSLSIQEIGARLGVAAVLEGGVRRSEDRIRINVQLNDCKTEAHLWAETYDRELTATNIFGIQTEIAASVAAALRTTLSPEERDRFATVPTENLAAYQAYILGKQRMAQEMNATVVEAADYFQQAVDLDPNYALAYVGLADSYTLRAWFGTMPRDEALAKAQAAVDKALALDARSGEAYNSLAGINDERGDFEGAEAAYQRALELNPNYAYAYNWYGELLRNRLARPEEALVLHRTGIELDPLSAPMMAQVGWDLQFLGRYEESLAWFENAVELEPGYSESYVGLGRHYWIVLGRFDEAVVALRKAISLDPGRTWTYNDLGFVFLNLGDLDRAEYWFKKFLETNPERFDARNSMMFLHLHRGDEASAVDIARKLMAEFPRFASPLMLLRNHELRAGRYVEARALYEKMRPELLSDDVPEVAGVGSNPAIDLALVLLKTGETERADRLLNRQLQYLQAHPRPVRQDWGGNVAQIFALQGQKQKALSALRQLMDEGWREGWWYIFKHEPNLEPLHDEPEFQAMIAEIEADMADQLARVRELQRSGELTAIPELATE